MDASALGWGSYLGSLETQGLLLAQDLTLHVNVKEFRAIQLACQIFFPYVRKKSVHTLRQHSGHVLCEQARRAPVNSAMPGSNMAVGALYH